VLLPAHLSRLSRQLPGNSAPGRVHKAKNTEGGGAGSVFKLPHAVSHPLYSILEPASAPSLDQFPIHNRLHVWQRELASDPDKDFLLNGITHGFDVTDSFHF
jgi:hypothetical protein